jgi:hypothetical protein
MAAAQRVDQLVAGADRNAFDAGIKGSLSRVDALPTIADIANIDGGANVIPSSGYSSPGIGGALYRILTGAGPFIATRWRRQSRGGQWYELDDKIADVTHFGLIPGVTNTDAMLAAFDWINEYDGRVLGFPRGAAYFETDLRMMKDFCRLEGRGGQGRSFLSGRGNARLILGQAIKGAVVDGAVQKEGTKIVGTTIRDLCLQPAGNHGTTDTSMAGGRECLLVDFADQTRLHDVYVGPSTQNGATITHGIRLNWMQWFYMSGGAIAVNGHGLQINLPGTYTENEEHVHLTGIQFYNAKVPFYGFKPVHICFVKETSNNTTLGEFTARDCHFGKFMSNDPSNPANTKAAAITAAFAVASFADREADFACVSDCVIDGNMFEYVNTIVDSVTLSPGAGADSSFWNFTGNYFLQNGKCFYGKSVSKTAVILSGNKFLQYGQISDGMKCYFTGPNGASGQMDQTIPMFAQSLGAHRFAIKENNGGISGVRISQTITVTALAGTTSTEVTHALSARPGKFRPYNANADTWRTSFSFGALSDTLNTNGFITGGKVTVYHDAPTANKTFTLELEVITAT